MSLSPDQLLFADKVLEAKILRSNGASYEDLFIEVMTLRHADFRPVKPQGNIGDRKNDGYRAAAGIFYQVYAPEAPGASITTAVTKIETDFDGLKAFWDSLCRISSFYFVFNDKFQGAYPTIEQAMLRIKVAHGLSECAPYLVKDLMREIAELDERSLLKLVGSLPSPETLEDLDFGVFTDVLKHVIENTATVSPSSVLTVPDFSDKIRLNDISSPVGGLLTTASLQSGAVETFFSSHGEFSKPAIRDKLAAIYAEVRQLAAGKPSGDTIFFGLLDAVVPRPVGRRAQDAAMVLLAYFFESCDIYEDPEQFKQRNFAL